MIKKIFFLSLIFISLFAKDRSYLTLATGVHDVLRNNRRCQEFLMEYKMKYGFKKKLFPFFGAMMTTKKSFYSYFGLSLDVVIKEKVFVFPSLALGLYFQGSGKDLGFPLEFRSCMKFGWQFKNFSRLGAGIYHISNASLGDKNPGEESVILFYSIAL